MNRVEQKERLKSIIETLDEVIETFKSQDDIRNMHNKIDEIEELLDEYSQVDWDGLREEVFSNYLNGETTFTNLKDEIEDFQTEINEYMDEVSDLKRDKLEERYQDLDEVLEILDLEEIYNNEDLLEGLSKIKDLLNGMRK